LIGYCIKIEFEMKLVAVIFVLALAMSAQCWVYEGHEMKGDASK